MQRQVTPSQKLFVGRVVNGWAVIRDRPWHFAGLYKTEDKAGVLAARLGPDYAVRYGQRRCGTFGFMVIPMT